MMKVHFRTQIFSMMLVALGWQIQASALEPVAQEPAAGRVSMVLGAAWLDKPGADRRRISIGMQVGAGDLVQTEPNGHVHIRFIDNALVSVRPDSRLEIVRYEYNRENPALSTVKFGLIEGVTRSISGAAATSARQRFRLNTPIAAIGVRGTDFVVSATRDSVRALVNEGAIVLAPYSAECAAEAFGPCVANAVELSGASEQMLGFDISSPVPRVLSAVHEFEPDALRGDIVGPIEEAAEIEEGFITANDGYLEGITNDRVSAGLANLGSSAAALGAGAGIGSLSIIVSDFTPVVPFGAEQTVERQLVWGRWGAGKGVLERITYAYEDVGQGRQVSVGNLEYALFRPGLGSRNVNSGLGAVKFDLAAAHAFYENGDNAVAMQVRGGDLSINFDRSVFSTGLELHHDLTGAVLFSAEGRIHDGGFFRMNGNGRRLSGAVTLDGKEAGYHFQQQLEQGNISGLTLWDSR